MVSLHPIKDEKTNRALFQASQKKFKIATAISVRLTPAINRQLPKGPFSGALFAYIV